MSFRLRQRQRLRQWIHTDDPDLALEITMDHLTEDLDYYDKLAQIEARVIAALKRVV